jgi:carbon storage regulator
LTTSDERGLLASIFKKNGCLVDQLKTMVVNLAAGFSGFKKQGIDFDQDVEGDLKMLVLTRKLGESIAIDDHIKIRVVQIKGKQVRLGIEAPMETKIHREEVYIAIQHQNEESVQSSSESTRALAGLLKSK